MGKIIQGSAGPSYGGGSRDPIDWTAFKEDVLGRLNLIEEYKSLGLRLCSDKANGRGVIECHAIDREDESPSAFINPTTGVYHDSGNGGRTVGFFDFALTHGNFGQWSDVLKHYATRAGVELGTIPKASGGRVREAIYHYRDESWETRYAVFRYRKPTGKKTFSQHPPDGKGGWKAGAGCMNGIEPLPYRLPELLAAPEATVWVFEGEKDCDLAASLGLVCTTNHEGAAATDATWPKFLHHFAGRDVRIVPDNDQAGRTHAHKIARHLKPIAKSVKVVEIAGLPKKGDFSDFHAIGGTAEDLRAIESVAPDWSPELPEAAEADFDPDRDATLGDLRKVLSEDGWLWKGWIPKASLTLLAAEGGTGKTRLSFDLHRRICQGLDWPDGQPMPLLENPKALWVVADNQWAEIADLATAFGIPDEYICLNSKAGDPYSGTSLESPEELADFEARIQRIKPAVVFIDTITNTGDFDVQDANAARKQYKPLQDIAARTGVPIICVTHLNAGGKVLGRRAVEKVRVVIQLECPDPDGQWNRRRLWVSKSKAIKPEPLGVTMGDAGNEYDNRPPDSSGFVPASPRKPAAAQADKLKAVMGWLRSTIEFEGGRSRVSKILNSAEFAGHDKSLVYKARDALGVQEDEQDGYKFWTLGAAASGLRVVGDKRNGGSVLLSG